MSVISVLGLAICNLVWKSTIRVSIENACDKSCICLEINLMAQTFPFIPTSLKIVQSSVHGFSSTVYIPLERYIAHYVTYKDYAPLGWTVGYPELPCYASV